MKYLPDEAAAVVCAILFFTLLIMQSAGIIDLSAQREPNTRNYYQP